MIARNQRQFSHFLSQLRNALQLLITEFCQIEGLWELSCNHWLCKVTAYALNHLLQLLENGRRALVSRVDEQL